MKFLHLSDLHIGKVVNGFSMLEDQVYILGKILEYVREHRPDAAVIAGDVYDRAVPGPDAVRVFDDFLTALAQAGGPVMLIAGNHDSRERLAFGGRIMREQGVHICGGFEGRAARVPLEDAHGRVVFHLLPFVRPAQVRRCFPDEGIESYGDAVRVALSTCGLNPEERNVLVSHQFYAAWGSDPERSESEVDPVGGLEGIGTEELERFDYAALGHLHGPQQVGTETARYAGSPLKYSFSEHRHRKSVVLVELGEKGRVDVRTLPLVPLRDMRKIRGPMAQLLSDAVASEGNPEDYLHVTLTDEHEILDAMARVRSVYPNAMALEFENSRTRAAFRPDAAPSPEQADPLELFADFYEMQNGAPLTPEQRELAREALDEASGDAAR